MTLNPGQESRRAMADALNWRLIGLLLERPRSGWIEEAETLAAETRDRQLRDAVRVARGAAYGNSLCSRIRSLLQKGQSIHDAYAETLKLPGSGVIFTGITLATGVATWLFAPIKFQADMGILLTFMLLLNMAGAIILAPALAFWIKPKG